MRVLVIDASVWVSAADATDSLSEPSRTFLSVVTERATSIAVPDFAELEVACALARRLRDAERGEELASQMLRSPLITVHPLDASLLRRAIEVGTAKVLRAGDAVYAAASYVTDGEIVSWGADLIQRAGAVTPHEWLQRSGPADVPQDEGAGDEPTVP